MIEENVVINKRHFNYAFFVKSSTTRCNYLKPKECKYCCSLLNYNYVKIINKLIEAKLLQKDYEYLCCACYLIKKKTGKNKCKCGTRLHYIFDMLTDEHVIMCPSCDKELDRWKDIEEEIISIQDVDDLYHD